MIQTDEHNAYAFVGSIIQHYHTPRDTYQNTRDENFDRLFDMIVRFVEE